LKAEYEDGVVAYHYFNYKEQENQTGDKVAASLLKQLLLHSQTVPEEVENVFNALGINDHPGFSKLLWLFQFCVPSFSKVFVILDGLDECNGTQMEDMAKLVRQFMKSNIKVFVTSRPHIQYFIDLFEPDICPIKADGSDIEKYLTEKLEKALIEESLKHKIKEELQNTAQGAYQSPMFQER